MSVGTYTGHTLKTGPDECSGDRERSLRDPESILYFHDINLLTLDDHHKSQYEDHLPAMTSLQSFKPRIHKKLLE